jgi:hypothetical protein
VKDARNVTKTPPSSLAQDSPLVVGSADQRQNLRGQGPLAIDESIAMGIGLGKVHLFPREGLEFHHFGLRQIPYPFKLGVRVHTLIEAHFGEIQPQRIACQGVSFYMA